MSAVGSGKAQADRGSLLVQQKFQWSISRRDSSRERLRVWPQIPLDIGKDKKPDRDGADKGTNTGVGF